MVDELKDLKLKSKSWTAGTPERHIFRELVIRASQKMGDEEWRDVIEAIAGCFEKDAVKDY